MTALATHARTHGRAAAGCFHVPSPRNHVAQIVSKARLPVVSETKEAPAASGPSTQDLVTAMAAQSYFMVTPVRDMLSTFKFGPFIALTEGDDTSVLDAALILGRYVRPTARQRAAVGGAPVQRTPLDASVQLT